MRRLLSKPVRVVILVLSLSLLSSLAEARVTGIEIKSCEVVADGSSFGNSGPYEKLRGTVFFAVDPSDPRNAVVFDRDKAPQNKEGLVEFSADFFILKPVDLKKGNGGLFFEVANRGNKTSLRILNDLPPAANANNPTTALDFGNGFLLRQGYTLAWVGWEADVLPGNNRLTVQFPIATEGGKPITELILIEFWDIDFGGGTPFTLPLGGNPPITAVRSYESVSTDQAEAMAELRMRPSDSPRPPAPDIPEGEVIPTSQWSFARCPDGPPGTPSRTDICLRGGFRNDRVYQLKYKAMDPPVMGLGYVTTRDFVSFLRQATTDDAGNPNPVPGLTTVLGHGYSQSGFYVRDFIHQGFNEDEQGRRVFDGMHIRGAGVNKLALNYRFAQPIVFGPLQHAVRFVPDTNFPRTYAIREDPLNPERMDGILKRPATDPKIIHTDSASEYWQLRSSLVDTDEDGTTDLDQPDNVRRYLFASTQHGTTKGADPTSGICQQLSNPTHNGMLARALLVALDKWVRYGTEPPDSRVPRIADGTLVPPDQYCRVFPGIPGVTCNGLFNAPGERYFGKRVEGNGGVIDPDYLIPEALRAHQVLVPKADALGNDIAGIRHPLVEAPVATLTGWNLRRPEFTDGDLCNNTGMMIPLKRTRDEQLAAADPRPSLEELYGDHTGYVLAVAKAALDLWARRLMLLEDVFESIQEADESDVLR